MIKLQEIEGLHELLCPECKTAVLKASAEVSEATGRGDWLDDSDSIPCLNDQLSSRQRTRSAFEADLSVGTCHECGIQYGVVQAGFMQGEYSEVSEYLLFDTPLGNQRNFVANLSIIESPWLVERYSTPKGMLYQHYFGPYPVTDGDKLKGDFGVSSRNSDGSGQWCKARELLLSIWDDLQQLT